MFDVRIGLNDQMIAPTKIFDQPFVLDAFDEKRDLFVIPIKEPGIFSGADLSMVEDGCVGPFDQHTGVSDRRSHIDEQTHRGDIFGAIEGKGFGLTILVEP